MGRRARTNLLWIVAVGALWYGAAGNADTINPRPKPTPTPPHQMVATALCHDIHLYSTQKERDLCMIMNMPKVDPPK